MKRVKVETFTAQLTLGLNIGYTDELIGIDALHEFISQAQHETALKHDVKLSASVSLCTIVFMGQEEPSVQLGFIQYPKFWVHELKLKEAIIYFTQQIMELTHQNRAVVVFQDETIMFEKSDEIDPNINIESSNKMAPSKWALFQRLLLKYLKRTNPYRLKYNPKLMEISEGEIVFRVQKRMEILSFPMSRLFQFNSVTEPEEMWLTNKNKWLKLFLEDLRYGVYTFKKHIVALEMFQFNLELIDDVGLEEFIIEEPRRLPLFLGTQFGMTPSLVSLPEEFHSKRRTIAVLAKSVLSGLVDGLVIYEVFNKEMVKIRKFKNWG